ncbi:MAG: response regulator [Verrucomicrobiales bacterium]|nr:response regulator [Verrucomicrobiales bacterium]
MSSLSDNIKNAKILIVDDTKMMRSLMSRHLRDTGFVNVAEVEDGSQALAYIEEHPVDFMLLDIMMPVMDGYETLENLKASGKLSSIAVVMVTAVDEIEAVAKCIELGAADYMPKLFNPILLNLRIESNLQLLFMRRRLAELGDNVN